MAADIDSRGNKFPVARINIDNITMADGGTVEGTVTEAFTGIIGTICLKMPDSTNGVTTTLSIRDSDGFELYSSAGIIDNSNTILSGVDILVAGVLTIGMTASADPGADWTSTNIILYSV